MVNLYPCNLSLHRASLPFRSWCFISHFRLEWSVMTENSISYMYCRNFSMANTTARHSFSVVYNFFFGQDLTLSKNTQWDVRLHLNLFEKALHPLHCTKNGLSKLGLISTGLDTSLDLSCSKAIRASGLNWNLNDFLMGAVKVEKSGKKSPIPTNGSQKFSNIPRSPRCI